jgi:hypothetical protein
MVNRTRVDVIYDEKRVRQKLRNIIIKIHSNQLLSLDELLLIYEYFPKLYHEYCDIWIKYRRRRWFNIDF